MKTICGIDCNECEFKDSCGGCRATNGQPFGESCIIAECCNRNGFECCEKSCSSACKLKAQLIEEFNSLGIEDMEKIINLNALKGSFVNLEYTLPSGQSIKFWNDNKIYLGNQVCKKNSDKCYGLTADENYLLVCEYGDNGANPEVVVFKKRNYKGQND